MRLRQWVARKETSSFFKTMAALLGSMAGGSLFVFLNLLLGWYSVDFALLTGAAACLVTKLLLNYDLEPPFAKNLGLGTLQIGHPKSAGFSQALENKNPGKA